MQDVTFPWDETGDSYTLSVDRTITVEDGAGNVEDDDVSLVNFADNLDVTQTSSGEVKVTGQASGSVDAQDGGSNTVNDVSLINFDTGLSYTISNTDEINVTAIGGLTFIEIPQSRIDDTDRVIGTRFRIPDGEVWEFTGVGVQNDAGNAPTGLNVQLYNYTDGVKELDVNQIHKSGTPLVQLTGPKDVVLRLENNTGSRQLASGHIKMEEGTGTSAGRTDVSDSSGLVQDNTTDIKFTSSQDASATGDLVATVSQNGSGATVDYSFTGNVGTPIVAYGFVNIHQNGLKGQAIDSFNKASTGIWRVTLDNIIGSGSKTQPDLSVQATPYIGWDDGEVTQSSGLTFSSWAQDPQNDGSSNKLELRFKNENGDLADPYGFSLNVIDL